MGSKQICLAALVTVGLGSILAGCHQSDHQTASETLSTAQIKKNLQPTMSQTRVKRDNRLADGYQTQAHRKANTLASPYVKLNPYQTSPLTALVAFTTPRATQVTVKVVGTSEKTTITHTVKGYQRHHQVGITGLAAGKANQVTLTAKSASGRVTTKTVTLTTKAAPKRIGQNTVKTSKPQVMALGKGNDQLTFAVSSLGLTYGLDTAGNVRWYSSRPIAHVFKVLKNHHLLVLYQSKNGKYNTLVETDYYGRIYREYDFKGVFPTRKDPHKTSANTVIHHDAIELPDGNLMLTVDDGGSKYVEDTMIELNRRTGKIMRVIDLKKIFPASAYTTYTATKRADGKVDWFHQNTIYFDNRRQQLLVSGRNQSTVLALDWKTMKIKWIFGSHQGWPKKYQKYLLKQVGTPFSWNGGQHAAGLIQTGQFTGNTERLEFYNNNVTVTRGAEKTSKQYSNGAIYDINVKKMTVRQKWTFGQSLGKANFTNIIGSSYRLNGQNSLLNFGYCESGKRSEFVEVNRKTNQIVYAVNRTDFPTGDWTYRAERLPIYLD
ncbi:aryl-sulfate sulfotransferase [Levilactobacillus bambusae]|nr:aryl-sulfate sulfotransferase [Levilactobacillus bambusae]